ncbi:acetate kinase [Vallitalea okinawensis]|uniref:acetate kinase n=1 Tax=Vallitalea okinawensis TaxID=2078660 RepID=UPI000CFAF721|nr:acetate kinase [Vallitalea okinawensis]
MKTLVINCGSSSLKYQLIDMTDESVLADGIAEMIAIEGSRLKHKPEGGDKIIIEEPMPDHQKAIEMVIAALTSDDYGVIKDMSEIQAVGHRVVHGGEKFKSSVLINDEVIQAIEDCADLAPLHNPANLIGINACKELLPNVPMVAVFDTAFHQSMPQKAYLYGLPFEYYNKYGVRRYGFHGTSHRYVSARTAEILGKPVEELKIVVCHLGNGASCCAVDGGKSVDTSMGLTPLEGLIMGTRSGDIDPAIIQFIMDKEGISIDEMMNVLNKKSGVLGVSEISSDFRAIEDGVAEGDKDAQRANDVCNYRVAKYAGAYAAAMNGLDAIVFTAGLGENNPLVRQEICEYLEFLGLKVDKEANKFRSKERVFSTADSKVAALCVPTNEELMIARDTKEIVKL